MEWKEAACGIALVGLRSSLDYLTPHVFTFVSYREDEFYVKYLQKEFF